MKDKERIEALLLGAEYRFAKTMTRWPHWYTLRNTWKLDQDFIDCVVFIREFGYKMQWGKYNHTYYDIKGKRYWTMGNPMEITKLINRADNP